MILRAFPCLALLASGLLLAPAARAQTAAPVLTPLPPGTVVQSLTVAMAGGPVVAVASREPRGTLSGSGQAFQWTLSLYRKSKGASRRIYVSPSQSSSLLSTVTQAESGAMWFPRQEFAIDGAGRLMGGRTQQLVVQTHEAAADCGLAQVAVLGSDPRGGITARAILRNYCALSAKVEGDHVVLSGPYYAANAPLCCATKPHATAILRYRGGRWTVTPPLFQFAK